MPRVPLIDRSVSPAPMPGARDQAVSNDGLQRAATGLGRSVAGVAADIRQQEIDKVDEQAVFEFRRRMNQWESERIYDPQKGAIATKGRQAFDLPKSLDDEFKTFVAEAEKGLTTDRQRMAARQMAEGRRVQINEWANKHEYGERERFYLEQYGADIENSKERAAASLDINTARTELAVQRQRTVEFLTGQGKSPEVIQQQIERDATDMHGRVIKSLMAKGRDTDAEAYYAEVRDQMDDNARAILDQEVAENSRETKTMRFADSVSSRFYSPLSTAKSSGEIMTEAEAVEAAKKEAGDDPKLRAKMVNAARFEWSLHEKRIKDERDKTTEAGARMAGNGMSLPEIKEMLGPQWADLTPPQKAAIQGEIARRLGEGEPNMNDGGGRGWVVYTSFKGLPPEQVNKLTMADLLAGYKPYLDDRHYASVLSEWSAVQDAFRAGRGTKDPKVSAKLTFNQAVENTAKLRGLVPADKTPAQWSADQSKRYAQFEQVADQAIYEAEQAKGGPLSPAERQEELDKLLFKTVHFDKGMSSRERKIPASLVLKDEAGRDYVPLDKIPDAEDLRNIIQEAGGDPKDDDKVQRMRAAQLRNDYEAFLRIARE